MLRLLYLVVGLLVSMNSFSQDSLRSQVEAIPLPKALASLPNEMIIYSTPNPDFPEFTDKTRKEVVWEHATVIKAKEPVRVVETGACLLSYGKWWTRAKFNEKQTSKMFNTKSLDLNEGDSIVFEKNRRVEPWTRSGWNFWYVKAVNTRGDTLFGYDILHTTGAMKDGTQILALVGKESTVNWTGSAGDSDYTLSGTIERMTGKIIYNNETLSELSVTLDMKSLSHEIEGLVSHLKSKDFFHVNKYSDATFEASKMQKQSDGSWKIQGELCLHGECNNETWTAQVVDTDKSVVLEFEALVNRTKYKVNYASSIKPDDDYSISDNIELNGRFSFKKDYPGSNPWNSVKPKNEGKSGKTE